MGNESETHYNNAKEILEAADVLVQPKNISEVYAQAAAEMKQAGDYKDAAKLAKKYAAEADRILQEGNEQLYQKACEKMNGASREVQRKLAADMFQRLGGYKDADERMRKCLEMNEKKKRKSTICLWTAVLAAVVVIVGYAVISNQPGWKYRKAESLFAEEKYEEARKIYEALGEYGDSGQKVQLCQDKKKEKNRQRAFEILKKAKIGDEVEFGDYRWVILDKTEKSALLMAVQVEKREEFSEAAYHEKDESVTWETSSLREWLNGEFLETGFDELERSRILLTDVKNEDNPTYHTDGGEDTQDYVYLPSITEAERYHSLFKFSLNWLLRTPGNSQHCVAYMTDEHDIMEYGCPVNWEGFYIRPMVNVNLQQ